MKKLRVLFWTVGAGVLVLLPSSPLMACNDCQNRCSGFGSHYDTCDVPVDWGWSGGCVDGCKPWNSCSIHSMQVCDGLDLDAIQALVEGDEWRAVAVAAVEGVIEFDSARGMIYVRSCAGHAILAQLPVTPRVGRIVDAEIDSYRGDLFADL